MTVNIECTVRVPWSSLMTEEPADSSSRSEHLRKRSQKSRYSSVAARSSCFASGSS